MTAHREDDLTFVVVGGYEYSPDMNTLRTMTVRELARRYRVLNLHSEAHGSILRRLQGRARHMGFKDVARTVFGPTRPRRVEERLWLAPVRGLASIGPLSVPEAMRRRNVRLFTRVIRDWQGEVGAENCVLLFYWWALPELVRTVPHRASIYDCSDDHAALPGAMVSSEVVSRLEGQLFDAVDRSYVVSPALLEDRAAPGRNISVLPNSFDLTLFRELQQDGFTLPDSLRSIPHPIVGYAGALGERMDWELISELTRRRPEWNFLFLGGQPRSAPESVHEQPNTYFQSSLPYTVALGAMSCFDVATIPFRAERFGRGGSFLKLRDYFAHGMPVVASPLPDTSAVAQDGDVLTLAEGPDQWEAALAAALAEPEDSPRREARRAYIEERSIARRVDRMISETLELVAS